MIHPELSAITKRLKDFEKRLYGYNYQCGLLLEVIHPSTDLSEVIISLSTKDNSLAFSKKNLSQISNKMLEEEVKKALFFRGDKAAGVTLDKQEETALRRDVKDFWLLFNQKFPPHTTQFYTLKEGRYGIYWSFAFLIISEKFGKIYLFEGGADD